MNYDFPFPKDPENPHDVDAVQADAVKGVGRRGVWRAKRAKKSVFLLGFEASLEGEKIHV